MPVANHPIEVFCGEHFNEPMYLEDEDGAAINISDWEVEGAHGSSHNQLGTSLGFTITDGVNGEFSPNYNVGEVPMNNVWALRFRRPGETRFSVWARGSFTISPVVRVAAP